MNFSSDAVAFRYGDSKIIPKRRFRRRVGLRSPLPGAPSRRCSAAQPRLARSLQWTEVDRAHRLWLALYATRPSTLESCIPADEEMALYWRFKEIVHDLRLLLRFSEGRASDPKAAILDSRTLRSTPESGSRGGYDGAKRKKGSKVHAAVDTLGHLLALLVTPASEQERARVGELAKAVQEATGESVELAYVDQGYTGERPAGEAQAHGISLEVVKHEEAKRGFVLLPRR
jgi:hypothetical protein